MKVKIHLLISFIAAVLLLSCSGGTVYKEHKFFDNLAWAQADKAVFTVTVDDDTSSYDLMLDFRYGEGFAYQFLNLEMKTTDPHGQSVSTQHQFKIRNDDKSYIGDASGDIWDFEAPIVSRVQLEKGTYTFELSHLQPQANLMMAMEVGLIIRKSESK